MALSLRRLDTDAFFLLTFSPIVASTTPSVDPRSYHILLDPWIAGPSRSSHFKISLTHQPAQDYISSLAQLPVPDLIIFSQARPDAYNEAAVCQIPADTKTLILAEPSAAKVIRGWKHFDRRNVLALKRWGDRHDWRETVTRIPLPPMVSGGRPGEVTVAYIPQARDLTGSRATVGITFRPPPMFSSGRMPGALKASYVSAAAPPLPAMPKSHRSYSTLPRVCVDPASAYLAQSLTTTDTKQEQLGEHLASWPTLRPARSTSALTTALGKPASPSVPSYSIPPSSQRTLSLLFSPRGIPFAGHLSSYATTHLVSEAALPLTVLLQRRDHVVNSWWLGRKALAGMASGEEIAMRLGARCRVSCHDETAEAEEEQEEEEEEETRGKGLSKGWLRSISPSAGEGPSVQHQVVHLASGEDVVVTSEGVWDMDGKRRAYAYEESFGTDVRRGMETQAGDKDTRLSPLALDEFLTSPLEDREMSILLAGGSIKNAN
ncbi:hypothetical protein M406DRAFT_72495 [Cryphonectria parasitica EP155]|uniref:Uncharacterized protein n=1 Tax=Cryphonectria parasitica (strain ATCC 38755 / EP155) TaxID=660469 RepID=A0A9P4XXQ5_CRYP1|nr:uncharacterized protein M406DRAFT_72495 [Cryphonectria parasitica EP155]KAF3762495.1 hypothetical protein M406DRAFT_72495 [Cryphonectria parasitica EP155]